MSIASLIKAHLDEQLQGQSDGMYLGQLTLEDNPTLASHTLSRVAGETKTFETFSQFKSLFDASTTPTKPNKPDRDNPELSHPVRRANMRPNEYLLWQTWKYGKLTNYYQEQLKIYGKDQEKRRLAKQSYSNSTRGYSRFIANALPNTDQNFFLHKNKFRLSESSRQKHTYITGGSGSGKSELMKTMIHHYMTENTNTALILIDPHGDIAEEVARFKENYQNPDRLVYIDPDLSPQHTPTINPFDEKIESQRGLDRSTQEQVEVFGETIKQGFTPQMRTLLKHCVPTLLLRKNSDLIDLKHFMEDENDRNKTYIDYAIGHLKNPELIDFLKVDFRKDGYNPTKQSIKTKLQELLSLTSVQNCLCGDSTFDLEQLINEKKIIIFNLSVGKLGAEVSELIGRFVIAQVKSLAFRRDQIPENQRVPCHLFIDECQRFLTESIEVILTEARKYGIHLTMANQFYGQKMSTGLKDAITSNTFIKITGRNSDKSLSIFAKETATDKDDLQNLSVGEFHVKEGAKPDLKVKAPATLLKSRNAMSTEQWREIKAQQLKRYYRPLDDGNKNHNKKPVPRPAPVKTAKQRPIEL